MKTALKTILKLACLLLAAAAVGYALITAVYFLPTEAMEANAADSAELFYNSGDYPQLIHDQAWAVLDNVTDSVMVATAAYSGDDPITDAMLNPRLSAKNSLSVVESFASVFSGNSQAELVKIKYSYYWHGYLVFLKPLLSLLDYRHIRYLMALVQPLIAAAAAAGLVRRKRWDCAAALLLAYLFLCPPVLALSLQYNTVYMLAFTQALLIAWRRKACTDRSRWIYGFLLVGCLTSYFDFLTYPLAAFGIPMLLLLSLYPDSPAKNFWVTVKCGLSWAFGYVGMWGSKWLIGSLVTGENIFSDAIISLLYRSGAISTDGLPHTELILRAIYNNLSTGKYFLIPMALIVFCAAVYAFIKHTRVSIGSVLLLCAFIAAPLAWYAVASNHSYVHCFFTYRTLSISVFAAALLALELAGRGARNMRGLKELE